MGKSLIQQARGKGGPSYRARSHAYLGEAKLRPLSEKLLKGKITDIVKCPGHMAPLIEVDFEDGVSCLMQAPEFVRVGDELQAGPGSEVRARIRSGSAGFLQAKSRHCVDNVQFGRRRTG